MKVLNYLLLTLTLTLALPSFAQKYEYKPSDSVEEDDYEIEFESVVSKNADYCKMAMKIDNISPDFLQINLKKITYTNDKFDQSFDSKKKLLIRPGKKKSLTISFNDEGKYAINDFKVDVKGLYLIPSAGNVMKAPDFKLPASNNEFDFDDFTVRLKKLKKETDETVATFEVTYKGRDIALVNPRKLSAVYTERGDEEYANDAKNAAIKVLNRGDKCTFRAVFHISAKKGDMQFEPMNILWKKTFQVTKKQKLPDFTVNFKKD